MSIIITDQRDAPRSAPLAPVAGDLFRKRQARQMKKEANVPRVSLISTCSFSPGRGVLKRWTRFSETPKVARLRLAKGQAMEDVTSIDGLDIGHAMILGRAKIRTFDELAGADPENLRAIGLDPDAVASILSWRNSLAPKEPDPEPDDFGSIKGVGPANVQKLHEAEVATFDQLRALGDDKLEAIGLSGPAMAGIRRWRGDGDE